MTTHAARTVLLTVLVSAAALAQRPPSPDPAGPRGPQPPSGPGGPANPIPSRAPPKVTPVDTAARGAIAPGSVQPSNPREIGPPGPPAVWAFADLEVKAASPTTVKIAWAKRADATHYRVLRDGVLLGETNTEPPATTWVDESLTPGARLTYSVVAVQRLPALRGAPGSGIPAGQPRARTLETTNTVSVSTPSIEIPGDFTVTLTDPKKRIIHLAWSLPKWVSAVEITRDGSSWRTTSSQAASFDDTPPAPGTHHYAIRTLYTAGPAKPIFRSDPSKTLALRTAPFTMVAVGDSIMWGQGLSDSAKFVSLTRDTLRSTLGVEVTLTSFAHSGAILRENVTPMPPLPAVGVKETTVDQTALATPGEVPNSFPTVFHQVNVQAVASSLDRAEVDLVLVGGCANDVGAQTILLPDTPALAVKTLSQSKCAVMVDVLSRVRVVFPNAAIVVTGYFPIVSTMSDLAFLPLLLAGAVGVGALAAPLVGIPPDPGLALLHIAAGIPMTVALRQRMSENSLAFRDASNAALQSAVTTVNTQAGASVATFAPVPFAPSNAYSTASSWLWLVPTGAVAGDQDDVIATRTAQCHAAGMLNRSVGFPAATTKAPGVTDMIKCEKASMGHPNHAGAQAYAAAIKTAFGAHVPHWRDRYATKRSASP